MSKRTRPSSRSSPALAKVAPHQLQGRGEQTLLHSHPVLSPCPSLLFSDLRSCLRFSPPAHQLWGGSEQWSQSRGTESPEARGRARAQGSHGAQAAVPVIVTDGFLPCTTPWGIAHPHPHPCYTSRCPGPFIKTKVHKHKGLIKN